MATVGLLASHAYMERRTVRETRFLVSDLCRHFYGLGFGGATGTGGSITIKAHDDAVPKARKLIVMPPSGVQKERMVPEDMYVLSSSGQLLSTPSPKPYPPLSMKTYHMRNAGSVIHSHRRESCLVTMLRPLEKELKDECYHYLFDAALNLHQLGVDWITPNHGPMGSAKPFQGKDSHIIASVKAGTQSGSHVLEPSRCIVLDIEGTTTPISFVADVLFPYARDNVWKHLISTYDTRETKEDIELLRLQVEDDLKQGILDAVPIPSDDAGKEAVIDSLVSNVEAMIKADRKITSLKQLQGHIWRTGFENNELQGIVYEDVPEALERWHANGIKVYIYSSGSREAQRLIFGNTTYGDLRKYLCGFFDTAVGNKRESRSYFEIFQSVGVDKPSQILFVTDVYQEAVAAKAAGLEILISLRPGNAPLPDNHGFQTISSFAEI